MGCNVSRGGKREGAGRRASPEALKKNPCPLRLPQRLIDWMDEQPETRASIITEAVIKAHKLKEPKKV